MTPTKGKYYMKTIANFYNEKGNVRPAARSEAKTEGFNLVKAALEAAGLPVTVDGFGSLYVPVGVAVDAEGAETTVLLRLDNVITTTVR